MAKIIQNALTISCCHCANTAKIAAKILDNAAIVELMLPAEWSSHERTNLRGCINITFKCHDCVDVLEEPCDG